MASTSGLAVSFSAAPGNPTKPRHTPRNHFVAISNLLSFQSNLLPISFNSNQSRSPKYLRKSRTPPGHVIVASGQKADPLRIMISGAPASGKGTQCELITKKFDLVHVAAGDLLRAEIASGSENGERAKEFMERGQLVPDEIVVMMVKERLSRKDCQEKGWLLDGYPRSVSQAEGLKKFGFEPDIFILLEVPEEILVERVVGRRLDAITGKIYHLKYAPPETDEIAARLTQRFDDTEEKVKLRLLTHNSNVEAVLSLYENIIVKVDGSLPKHDVFSQIDSILSELLEKKEVTVDSLSA